MPDEFERELVITVPLPDDRGRRGDGRPKVRRFRSHWRELGLRLREFRIGFGLTQTEVAQAVGAAGPSAVAQWEHGTAVPEGLRREWLVDLLAGRRWPELRAAMLGGEGVLPVSWDRGVRWYRRTSRERPQRESVGRVVAALLADLRQVPSAEALRERYCAHHGDGVRAVAERCGLDRERWADLRRVEDAAYGLRWLELRHGLQFDLRASLVPQLPMALVDVSSARIAGLDPNAGR